MKNNKNNNDNEMCSIDWTLIPDAIESELSDGHVPETFRCNINTDENIDDDKRYPIKQHEQNQKQQTLRIYPKYHMNRGEHVHIIDNSIPTNLLIDVYDYTIRYCTTNNSGTTNNNNTNKPAWGSYITMNEIRQHFDTTFTYNTIDNSQINNNNNNNNNNNTYSSNINDHDKQQRQQHNLSLHLALHFFRNAIEASNNNNNNSIETSNTFADLKHEQEKNTQHTQLQQQQTQQQQLLWTIDDIYNNDDIHGIALWGLPSTIQTNVPYHVDYAELIRYQYGYLIPPVLGGTLHCTPNRYATIENGDYYVIPYNGLQHYDQYGYKGLLVSSTAAVSSSKTEQTDKDEEKEKNKIKKKTKNMEDGAIKVQFQYNRMICQSGHLPHWSTPVTNIINNTSNDNSETCSSSSSSNSESNNNRNNYHKHHRRVIVGFNVFLTDIGDEVQKAPEHSDEFRSRVTQLRLQHRQKQQQLKQQLNLNKNCTTGSTGSSSNGFTIENIKSNPKLSSLLVQAKRIKNKNDFRIQQEQLDHIIVEYILQHNITPDTLLHSLSSSLSSLTILDEIVIKFDCQKTSEQKWPTIIDIQVHVQHRLSNISNLYLAKVQTEANIPR